MIGAAKRSLGNASNKESQGKVQQEDTTTLRLPRLLYISAD